MRKTSIRIRLMVLMICLTTLPVLTVTWIATNNTRSSVEKEMISANTSRLLWADQYLDELIQQIDILFYTLQINETLMAELGDIDSPDIGVQYKTQNFIRDTLISAFHANSRKIDELTLYVHANQKALTVNFANSGLMSRLDLRAGPWSRMLQPPVNMYFKMTGSGIYAFHSMNRFEDHALIGGLSARINKDVWQEVERILMSEEGSSFYLLNDEKELLSGSAAEAASDDDVHEVLANLKLEYSDLEFRKTDKHFVFMKKIADGQLTVVKAIPLSAVARSAQPTIRAGFVTGGLFAAASVLLSILVSLRISRPIVRLARAMRRANLQTIELTAGQSRDEIGLLERGYNSMTTRIKELIESEYTHEIEVKSAQIMALQAQINPHFLNNTLHLIGGMALAKDAPEIYRITRVIGDLLRYAIGGGPDLVPLADELKHLRNYLFIQEQRFAGRCLVTVDVEPEALDARLPKFTLQPLVENAFEHGLQRREGAWRAAVRVRRIGGRVAILIADEGVGMDERRLLRQREELRGGGGSSDAGNAGRSDAGHAGKGGDIAPPPKPGDPPADEPSPPRRAKGIGLLNVDARLKLQFGKPFRLRLWSREGGGTLVAVVVPAAREKEGDEA